MLTPRTTFTWRGEQYVAGKTFVSPEADVCRSDGAKYLVPAWTEETSPDVRRVVESSGRSWETAVRDRARDAGLGERVSTPTIRTTSNQPLYGMDYHGPRPGRESWRL